jgi:hypothetical protein
METTTALQSNAAPAEESQRFQQLQAGLPHIRQAPSDSGSLELIVARPAVNERNVLSEGALDLILGLHGDTWKTRGSSKTADGLANPDAQITLMSSRAIQLVAGNKDRWPEAGDQLFIDLDSKSARQLSKSRRRPIRAATSSPRASGLMRRDS